MDVGVYVSLYNDELAIKPCLEHLKQVFPQVRVFDIGSTDDGPEIVNSLGVPLEEYPDCRLSDKYIELKRNLSERHDLVFWIDGDEVYPVSCLNLIKYEIESGIRLIYGFWRNLKVDDKRNVYGSLPPIHKGPVVYSPKEFHLHRDWPREKIDRRDGTPRSGDKPIFHDIFCWHTILLNRSTKPEKKNRWKKRIMRAQEFKDRGLRWEHLPGFPWDSPRPELFELPKFVWYR